jgi:penicillin-binding protein 2
MVTASAALQEGIATTRTRIACPGMIVLPSEFDPSVTYPFFCWNRGGHGAVDLVGALAQSCDVYFYEVAGGFHENGADQDGLGSDRLGLYSRMFGLGQPTGIELLGEARGRVPSREWLAETQGTVWTTGATYHMGIGQGNLLVTPLQMAGVTATVANGGTRVRPHLVDHLVDPSGTVVLSAPGEQHRVEVSPEHLAVVRQGMRAAVTSGTARSAWSGLPTEIAIAGKTGTAEFCDPIEVPEGVDLTALEVNPCRTDKQGNLLTHAWFVAFAPYENPEIALAVFVDGSGLDHVIEGSQVAAPIAGQVLRAYFGLPNPAATPSPTP